MKRILPPLNGLKVFDEAAKHRCFKHAADSLFVTQSAVSKQIQTLESHLGVSLFHRQSGGVHLTPEGKLYHEAVYRALDIIESASQRFLNSDGKEILTVNILPSMSVSWLCSRVEGFRKMYPHILLQIHSDDDPQIWEKKGTDISITSGRKSNQNSWDSELLFQEELAIIASPELIEEKPITSFVELTDCSLIGLSSRPGLWREILKQQGIEKTKNFSEYRFQHFYMVTSAVINNMGVGFAPKFLCNKLIEKKVLVNLLDYSFTSDYGYYLNIPNHKRDVNKVALFSKWVKNEIQASLRN